MFSAENSKLANIFANILFGSIGFGAFIYGKKTSSARPLILGILLIGYSYFLAQTALIYLIGFALTALLCFWRE